MDAPPYGFLFSVTLPGVANLAGLAALKALPGMSFISKLATVDSAFHEVSGLSKESKPEMVEAGGVNRYTYRLPGAVSHPNLVLKRPVASWDAPLTLWCMATLEGSYAIPVLSLPLQINLLKPDHSAGTMVPKASWLCDGCYPVGWSVSDLNSQQNELAMERIELAYSNLVQIPAIP